MKKQDVKIGSYYLTHLSGALQRVKVQAQVELPGSGRNKSKTVWACLTPSHHVVRRTAAALREETKPRDLSGDPGHDMAERRDSPPPIDAMIAAGGLPIGAGDPDFMPGPFVFGDASVQRFEVTRLPEPDIIVADESHKLEPEKK